MANWWPLAVVSASLAVAGTAGAEGVYKWVDEQGRTHFTDTPPAGKKSDKLAIQPAPGEQATPPPTKTWQEQSQLANQRRHLAQDKEQQAAKRDQQDEQRCLAARRAVDLLNRERPIYRVNGQGEREYMEDAQRQATQETASQRVSAYCRN